MKSLFVSVLVIGLAFLANPSFSQPRVDLVWRSTTGVGTPGSDTIRADVGDELELDVTVSDNGVCNGLFGAFLSLYWDPVRVAGLAAEECPAPENFLLGPGNCHDAVGNLYVTLNPGVSLNPGSAESFEVFSNNLVAAGYTCDDIMYLGRMSFIVQSTGTSAVSLGFLPGEGVLDGDNVLWGPGGQPGPVATATILPPCVGCSCP